MGLILKNLLDIEMIIKILYYNSGEVRINEINPEILSFSEKTSLSFEGIYVKSCERLFYMLFEPNSFQFKQYVKSNNDNILNYLLKEYKYWLRKEKIKKCLKKKLKK